MQMTAALELEAVRAFILVAELGSFTLAAETLLTTQSSVSLRIKRLERAVGHRLIERTPRHVRLSAEGSAFLQPARELLNAHNRAAAVFRNGRQRLAVGVSDHVAGPELPRIIANLNEEYPELLIDLRIGSSDDLLRGFDRRELDVVVVRFRTDRPEGQVLAEEKFGWFAAANWRHKPDDPLPIAIMPEPCGVRIVALQLLDRAGIPWRESFIGGGVTAGAPAGGGRNPPLRNFERLVHQFIQFLKRLIPIQFLRAFFFIFHPKLVEMIDVFFKPLPQPFLLQRIQG